MKLIAFALAFVAALPLQSHADSSQDALPLEITAGPPRYTWSPANTSVALQFDGSVPSEIEVVRLARAGDVRAWHLADTIHATVSDGRTALSGPIGVETLLLIRAPGRPGYILDGPFRWPSKASTYVVRANWRKTLRGSFPGPHAPLVWVPADDTTGFGVACEWVNATDWECVGVPLHALGVVVTKTAGEVKCGIPGGVLSASGVEIARTRTTAWGRLVMADTGLPHHSAIRMTVKRLQKSEVRPPAPPEAATEQRVHVDPIANGVAWVSGGGEQDEGWIEIEASDSATERLDLREVTRAPADLPLRVQLRPSAIGGSERQDAARRNP
jgi:hypothetical protein